MSPALAGRFLSTVPPGKSPNGGVLIRDLIIGGFIAVPDGCTVHHRYQLCPLLSALHRMLYVILMITLRIGSAMLRKAEGWVNVLQLRDSRYGI